MTLLASRVAQFGADVEKIHSIVHGPAAGAGSLVATEGGDLRTLAKLLADAQAIIDYAAGLGVALATPAGADLVGYLDGGTVEDALNARLPEIGSYDAIRAYTGDGTAFYVRGVANIFDGGHGIFRVNPADTTSGDNNGTILVDALGRRWVRDFEGPIEVKWFGSRGDLVTDDTLAIQRALNYAKTCRRSVHAPGGKYLFTQLAVPSGVEFFGDGIGGYGSQLATNPDDATVLIQKAGVDDDAVVFDMPMETGFYRLFNVHLRDFIILKQAGTDTAGNGISARQIGTDRTAVANHGLINAVSVFERLLVRGFPENGAYFRQGGAPLYCSDLDFIFNGGYGLRIDGANYARGIVLRNIAGDGNKARSVIRIGSATADNLITIDGVFAEYRSDSPYGLTAGFPGAQPDAVEVADFGANSVVVVKNVYGNSIVADAAMRSAVFVNTSSVEATPVILFEGITLRQTGLSSGNKYSLYDNRTGVGVPSTVRAGVYSLSESPAAFVNGFTTFGHQTLSKPPVGTEGIQVKGNFPAFSWFEADAGTDNKGWVFGPSGGNLYLRTFNDALSSSDIVQTYIRSGGLVTRVEFQKELRATAAFSATGLPTYADNATATAGGLQVGYFYKTATGEVRVRV